MLLRAPDPNGLMAQAATRIWGQPNDSPNFQVAYNAMLQMSMYPSVLMEGKGLWPAWTNDSFDEAAIRSKLLNEYNVEIVGGFGPLAGQIWRIGLMGYSSRRENVELLLALLKKLI